MITIPMNIVNHPTMNPVSKLVYGVLVQEINKGTDGSCRISHDTIARIIAVGRNTSKTAVDQLYNEGFIEKSKDSKGWLSYTLKE